MKKNNSTIIWIIVIVVVLGILFAIPRMNDPNKEVKGKWDELGVACLPGGHVNLSQHIHARLSILVDENPEAIPGNIGVLQNCMAELHTHDTDGVIHIESVKSNKTFTLEQFFGVLDKALARDGYNLEVTVDGQPVQDPAGILFKDGQQIVLNYTKISN